MIKDLAVDRGAFDRIIQAGGFISVSTGNAPDGNAIPIPKPDVGERLSLKSRQCRTHLVCAGR